MRFDFPALLLLLIPALGATSWHAPTAAWPDALRFPALTPEKGAAVFGQ